MDIFSEIPKSFKINAKSRLASKLKSSISRKLLEFLSDYRDDVLAEYITVLVCNGKHQYQARDDLEAFLGKRSVEFVSWLWCLLLEYAGHSSTDSGLLYMCEVSDINPQSHSTGHAELLIKDDKTDHVPTPACDPVSSNAMKRAKGSHHCPSFSAPLSEVNRKTVLSQISRNEILRRVIETENINGQGYQSTQSKSKINQIVNHKCCGLSKELLHLPKREAVSKNTQFSILGPSSKQICASNSLGSILSPRFVRIGSLYSEKSRGSVWDRLGKPCEDISVRQKSVDFYGVGHKKQEDKVENQLALTLPKRNSEVPALGKNRFYSYPVEAEKLEHGGGAASEPLIANNVGRKRLFGEISTGPSTDSVSLVDEGNMDPQCKDISQDSKKSNLTKNGLKNTQKLVSEVLDVKQRLHQIEMEMSKLQSKQVEIEKKDGNYLLNSGVLKENFESRTVLVTNVHFSATREALSLHFAKCGVVVNVVILTDIVTAKPNGSAYVTFASKESVDKAVALSGTTIYSRTVKVLRKAEVAPVASAAPTQLAWKAFHSCVPHGNGNAIPNKPHHLSSNLKWQRGHKMDPSEPSAPASVEGVSSSAQGMDPSGPSARASVEGVSSSAHEQHPPSSSHAEGNTSSIEPPATAGT